MTRPHDPNEWMADQRPILEAMLATQPDDGVFYASTGITFERFERNGEMAAIPYLRATFPAGGRTTEAPLVRWAYVVFGEVA